MIFNYLFSSPEGDIPLSPDELETPFKITPSETHPSLTLGAYFEAIKAFILKNNGESLILLLGNCVNKRITINNIEQLVIRSEKHGALSHIASAEVFIDGHAIKYAVSTAVSEKGNEWLDREYDTLKLLGETFSLPYLPKVYFKGGIEPGVGKRKEPLPMFFGQWFEDYHEWHLSIEQGGGAQGVVIWDLVNGHRYISEEESYEIYRQAAKILTLYYDTEGFRQIYPWHHAAGDFVVRTKGGKIEVKLTTARAYEPVVTFPQEGQTNPLLGIIYFFLNMTIKMRLDKLDGVGGVVWAGDHVLLAVLEGFFEVLKTKEQQGTYHLGKVEDLRSLLKSFSWGELSTLFNPLREFYREEEPDDFSAVGTHIGTHTRDLYRAIQSFHL